MKFIEVDELINTPKLAKKQEPSRDAWIQAIRSLKEAGILTEEQARISENRARVLQ